MAKLIPEKNPYELIKFLGEGLSSEVYRALRKDPTGSVVQQVVVKILKSKNAVSIWRQEFESLQKVCSPFCVSVLGWEWFEGRPALILEDIDGFSLRTLLNYIHFQEEEVLEILRQIQEGLKDLYRSDTFHGDLSLGNILLSRNGRIKLVDFGLRQAACGSVQATRATAAPEVLDGKIPDFQADLYSLGRIAIFLMGHNQSPPKNLEQWMKIQKAYLAREAEKRSTFSYKKSFAAKKCLREKVCLFERRIEMTSQKTAWSSPSKIHFQHVGLGFARRLVYCFLGVTLCLMSPTSQARWSESILSGQVVVLTEKWVHIKWKTKDFGFTPVKIEDVVPGKYVLRWKTSEKQGSKVLTVSSGDNIVLTDKDFE